MTAVKTRAADGGWHVAITEGTVSFSGYGDGNIWDELNLDKAEVTSVSIPDTVTTVGSYAFDGCTSITSMILPESVTTIGSCAFQGCSGITSVILPESVTTIGNYAFRGCTSITSVILPESLTTIGIQAFSGCSAITSMILPESVTTLGRGAFYGCTAITSMVLPESLTTIGSQAFNGCTSITTMILPESVTTLGSGVFYGCTNLATLIVYRPPPPPAADADAGPAPAGLTVASTAFSVCPNIKRVSAPDQVVAALHAPYYDCATLAALPAAVTCNAFKLQIETYFWSMKLHRNTNRLSARQRAWVKHLLTVGSRARLHWRPVGKGPRSEPCLPAPNHPPLPCIMNDVWLHVLLFVKLSEMRAVNPTAEEEVHDPLAGVDVSKWKVAELKAELKRRHLIVGGKKAALVERLAGDVASKAGGGTA